MRKNTILNSLILASLSLVYVINGAPKHGFEKISVKKSNKDDMEFKTFSGNETE